MSFSLYLSFLLKVQLQPDEIGFHREDPQLTGSPQPVLSLLLVCLPRLGLPCQSVSTCLLSRPMSNTSPAWEAHCIALPLAPMALHRASPACSFHDSLFTWLQGVRLEDSSLVHHSGSLQCRVGEGSVLWGRLEGQKATECFSVLRFGRTGIGYQAFPLAFLLLFVL